MYQSAMSTDAEIAKLANISSPTPGTSLTAENKHNYNKRYVYLWNNHQEERAKWAPTTKEGTIQGVVI